MQGLNQYRKRPQLSRQNSTSWIPNKWMNACLIILFILVLYLSMHLYFSGGRNQDERITVPKPGREDQKNPDNNKESSGELIDEHHYNWIKLQNFDNVSTLEAYLREEIDNVVKIYDPTQFNLIKLLSREYNRNFTDIYQEEQIRSLLKKNEEYLDFKGNLQKKHAYGLAISDNIRDQQELFEECKNRVILEKNSIINITLDLRHHGDKFKHFDFELSMIDNKLIELENQQHDKLKTHRKQVLVYEEELGRIMIDKGNNKNRDQMIAEKLSQNKIIKEQLEKINLEERAIDKENSELKHRKSDLKTGLDALSKDVNSEQARYNMLELAVNEKKMASNISLILKDIGQIDRINGLNIIIETTKERMKINRQLLIMKKNDPIATADKILEIKAVKDKYLDTIVDIINIKKRAYLLRKQKYEGFIEQHEKILQNMSFSLSHKKREIEIMNHTVKHVDEDIDKNQQNLEKLKKRKTELNEEHASNLEFINTKKLNFDEIEKKINSLNEKIAAENAKYDKIKEKIVNETKIYVEKRRKSDGERDSFYDITRVKRMNLWEKTRTINKVINECILRQKMLDTILQSSTTFSSEFQTFVSNIRSIDQELADFLRGLENKNTPMSSTLNEFE